MNYEKLTKKTYRPLNVTKIFNGLCWSLFTISVLLYRPEKLDIELKKLTMTHFLIFLNFLNVCVSCYHVF
jgi:hypothetical protein